MKEKNNAILIIPYYGKLPSYFELWLQSVEYNQKLNFLIVSDLLDGISVPDNVRVLSWSFGMLKGWIQSKFDFKISLDYPYKLCDFKVAYGMIFSDYIKEYQYWGHCDVDLLFGDVETFIEPLLGGYDVIGDWGHFSLYRNNDKFINLFKQEGALFEYREVFSTKYIYAFDETSGIKRIVRHDQSIKYEKVPFVADISHKYKKMRIAREENYLGQIFIWDKGKVFQCYPIDSELEYKEFSYIHMQKRQMRIMWTECIMKSNFYIIPNGFVERSGEEQDKFYCKKSINRYDWLIQTYEYVRFCIKKVVDYIFMEKEQRKIYLLKRNIK